MCDDIAVAMRHEINNPLTTLLAERSVLEMGGNEPAEEREMVASIVDQAGGSETRYESSPGVRILPFRLDF